MKQLLITILLALITLPATAEVTQVDNAELQQLLAQGVPIIDVRLPEEWQETGIIPGSHMITFFDEQGNYDLDVWMPQLQKIATADKPIILICRTGNRTGVISGFLDSKMNYSKVYNVTNGITEWIDKGNQTVKP